jgi:hypothetical protein
MGMPEIVQQQENQAPLVRPSNCLFFKIDFEGSVPKKFGMDRFVAPLLMPERHLLFPAKMLITLRTILIAMIFYYSSESTYLL